MTLHSPDMKPEDGVSEPNPSQRYIVSFTDEFDEAMFDLRGKSFPLRLVGRESRTIGDVQAFYDVFAFEGRPMLDRCGEPVVGNLFLALSSGLKESEGPWGARVLAFDQKSKIIPIGRASLSTG